MQIVNKEYWGNDSARLALSQIRLHSHVPKNEERNKSEIKYKIHLFMRFWLSGLFHNSEILRKPSLNLYIINYIRFSEMKINVLKGLFFFSPNLGMQLGMI